MGRLSVRWLEGRPYTVGSPRRRAGTRGKRSHRACGNAAGDCRGLSQTLPIGFCRHPAPITLDLCRVLHRLASSWPLILVIVGTVLSRNCSTDNVNALQKKSLVGRICG